MSSQDANKKADGRGEGNEPAGDENKESGEGKQQEIQKFKEFKIDEYYPENHIEKTLQDSPLTSKLAQFHEIFGQTSKRRYNLLQIAKDTIIFICGNTYQIYNYATKERKVYFGKDSGGIGSIAVHPSKGFFGVAEKGINPNIYIYEYPSMKTYRILRKGTTSYYTSIDFSPSGDKLASVGGDPDYQLSIWDWRQERLLLKAKAFSQEVFKVSFSPYGDFGLITSGTGHIRFWKIASTFTGLKLQSEIGKFGQLELSDVSSFIELTNGMVLSGTEYGTLLLWDGNMVKAHIKLLDGKPLHNGMIEQVMIDDKYVITAGKDGFIKWFDLAKISSAEPDETLIFNIAESAKISITHPDTSIPAHIVSIIRNPDFWLLSDGRGKLWSLKLSDNSYTELMHFHAGKINDMIHSKEANALVSIGNDGFIKLFDYANKKELFGRHFNAKGICLDWMPDTPKSMRRIIAAGFSTGVVRILLLNDKGFELIAAFKPLDSRVVKVGYSADATGFFAAGEDGSIFFFDVSITDIQSYTPVCMIELKKKINDARWNKDSKRIIVAAGDGSVIEILRPDATKIDTKLSYSVVLPTRVWKIKMMECQMKKYQVKEETEEEKRKKRLRMYTGKDVEEHKEEEEKEWEPEPVLTVTYFNEDVDQFIITAAGQFSGWIYICSFNSDRPVQLIPYNYKGIECKSMTLSQSNDLLLIGLANGRYQLRRMANLKHYMEMYCHDSQAGNIRRALTSNKNTYLLSTGDDGLIFVHKLNNKALDTYASMLDTANEETKWPDIKSIPSEEDNKTVAELNLSQPIGIGKPCKDIEDKKENSIQKMKLMTEENIKKMSAEEKKERLRAEIDLLRKKYESILKSHIAENRTGIGKEFDEVINIDNEYFTILTSEIDKHIQEVCKELEYDKAKHKAAVQKLRAKYMDQLEFQTIMLKGIKSHAFVRTFRLKKIASFIEQSIKEYNDMVAAEKQQKEKLDTTEESIETPRKSLAAGSFSPTAGGTKEKKAATFHLEPMKEKIIKKTTAEINQELRRDARKKTKDELEKHRKLMPKGDDDPEYKGAKERIEKHKGDIMLKSDDNYDVPEDERKDAKKQRYEMIQLEQSLYNIQKDLNERVLKLRDRKKEIVEKAKAVNGRIREINKELKVNEELFEPALDYSSEFPEKYYQVQDEDLIKYAQGKREAEKQERLAAKGAISRKESEGVISEEIDYYDSYLIDKPKLEGEKGKKPGEEDIKLPPDRKDLKVEKSGQEEEQLKIRSIELLFEKETLQAEVKKEIEQFDIELEELQHEKLRLESDKKYCEMKIILDYEALSMLKALVDRDSELTDRLNRCKQEKVGIAKQFNEIAMQMKEKEGQLDALKEEKAQIMGRFDTLIPINHPARDELYAFFMRNIKKKAKAPEEEKAEELSDKEKEGEEEEENSEEEEDKDAIDEDEDARTQPGGANKDQYHIDQILDERMKKREVEDKAKKLSKANNLLKKKSDDLERQKEAIEGDEKSIENEIKIFQREKMKRLNKMEHSFVLRMRQIRNLEEDSRPDKKQKIESMRIEKSAKVNEARRDEEEDDAGEHEMGQETEEQRMGPILEEERKQFIEKVIGKILPGELNDSLLFTTDQIEKLRKQIGEHKARLEEEKKKQVQKEAENTKLIIQITEKDKELKRVNAAYQDELQLKFGQIIKLDEEVPWTGETEGIKKKEDEFKKVEDALNLKIKQKEAELEAKKRELNAQVTRNSELLKKVKQFGEEETKLEKNLTNANKQIFNMDNAEEKQKLIEEKESIERELNIQNQKIDIIRKEIELFRRKGGHIYTTITANRRIAGMPQNEGVQGSGT